MSYITLVSYSVHALGVSTAPPMMCIIQLDPPQNGTISDHFVPALPGTQVTFQCDDGLSPEGIMAAICLDTGEWDKNPVGIACRGKCTHVSRTMPQ